MMFITKYRTPLAIIAGLLVLIGLYFLFDKKLDTGNQGGTDQTVDLGNGASLGITGDATIQELPSESVVPTPTLGRPITFENSVLPENAQETIRAKILADEAKLKNDSLNLPLWLEVGLLRKQAGDYKSAEEVWLYVNAVAEKDEISTLNLADLYMNFLKDYPKAELYYKQAISINPKNIDSYGNLFNLYKYLYKTDTNSAATVKAQALKQFPSDTAYIETWKI